MIEDMALFLKNVIAMEGPFSLDKNTIGNTVQLDSPGFYTLSRDDVRFEVHYVGRFDGDVRERLEGHVDAREREEEIYSYFMVAYADSDDEAFDYECSLFHTKEIKETLDNKKHPDIPDGSNRTCPICRHPAGR